MTARPEVMLTTIDNPWSPFTHFEEWSSYDRAKGYNTMSFLARIATTSSDLSEDDQEMLTEWAIDEIVKYNVLGKWKKVTRFPDGTER